ncbi:MAG: HRDC domain-containing protein [Victivallales bacterium]|nr:HRDC domain-containing protein [Victivallales bacterium]
MWIDNDKDFSNWCAEAQQHSAIALDTEFVWTKTYYPALGLLQMAWDRENTALVDVFAITDTTPLAALLQSADITKIFHEAASDLPILRRWCGGSILPQTIFDTRIAAGFVGLTASLSLNRLLTQALGITLPKTETRTDWLQRPLTTAQLEYASGDVDFMPELYSILSNRLKTNGNEAWFLEEMLQYSAEKYYAPISPADSWKRVSGNGRYSGNRLAIIAELAAWREKFACQNNIARPRVISDEQICLCAETTPQTAAELIKSAGMRPKNAERYALPILNAIARGMALPIEQCPAHKLLPLDSKVFKDRTKRIKKLVLKRSSARDIDSVLVASRKDMESLVIASATTPWPIRHPLLEGWKRELLGDTIEQLVRTEFSATPSLFN